MPRSYKNRRNPVPSRFHGMVQRVTPSRKKLKGAIGPLDGLRRNLKRCLPHFRALLIMGSFSRGTAISPLHDVDILCIVDPPPPTKTPRQMIVELRAALNACYPSAYVKQKGAGVELKLPSISASYDVVPAFPVSGAANLYKFAKCNRLNEDDGGKFYLVNPVFFAAEMRNMNRETAGKMKKFVQAMKYWNELHGKVLKSAHLELLCYGAKQIIVARANARAVVADLFRYLSQHVFDDCIEPGIP